MPSDRPYGRLPSGIVAGMPWLDVYCPGCRTSRAIDISTVERHALASVGRLVLGLRCSFCPGSAPMPVLAGLHVVPQAARWSKSMPIEFLHGPHLSPEDLQMIRQQAEAFDNIGAVDDEIRGIVAAIGPCRSQDRARVRSRFTWAKRRTRRERGDRSTPGAALSGE